MDERKTIVDRIRALANAQGDSLPTLEMRLGLGNGTISRWSKSSPNTDKLAKVADHFNVSIDYLLGREGADNVSTSSDPDIRRIERARKNMSDRDKEKMMALLTLSFEKYFSADYEDTDTDE